MLSVSRLEASWARGSYRDEETQKRAKKSDDGVVLGGGDDAGGAGRGQDDESSTGALQFRMESVSPHHLSTALCFVLGLSVGEFQATAAFLPSSFFLVVGNIVWGCWLRSVASSEQEENRKTVLSALEQGHLPPFPRGSENTAAAKNQRGEDQQAPHPPNFFPQVLLPLGVAVFAAVLATLVSSWPFGAVVFVNFCFYVFYRHGFLFATACGLISGAVCLLAVVLMDRNFYPNLQITPWNTFQYNNPFGGRNNSTLYGVESFSYYPKNLLLNFNFLFPLALLSFPVTFFSPERRAKLRSMFSFGLLLDTPGEAEVVADLVDSFRADPWTTDLAFFLSRNTVFKHLSCSWALWLLLLSLIEHKEERFLYPVYPLLCLSATVAAVWLTRGFATRVLFLLVGPASLLRALALVNYFGEPVMDVWQQALKHTTAEPRSRICLANDWYRFPGHWFVAESSDVHFVESEFKGILPAKFDLELSPATNEPFRFNDRNREERDRYVPRSTCDFFVESYSRDELLKVQQRALFCRPVVDLEKSRQPFRSLFLLPINSYTNIVPLSFLQKFLSLRYYCLVRNGVDEGGEGDDEKVKEGVAGLSSSAPLAGSR